MTDQFKFKIGDVLRHKASGEKVIVGGVEVASDRYAFSTGIAPMIKADRLGSETVFELVEPEKIGCGCQGIIDLCKCLHARQVQRLIP